MVSQRVGHDLATKLKLLVNLAIYIFVYISESFCCTPETNNINQLYFSFSKRYPPLEVCKDRVK